MIYALGMAAVIGLLTVPVVLALYAIALRARGAAPRSESLLLAMTLAPLVPLAEVLGLSLAPIDRPLTALLPWAHIGLMAVGVAIGWRRCLGAAAGLVGRTRRCFYALDPATRTALCIALAVLLFAFAHAAWNAGDEHDGAMYRLPIVMQPVQDGRVGPVAYPPPNFADAYPRTIEYLYSWTMLCTGTSVGFHLVNWYFLCMLGLATFVAARRAALRLRAALLSSALVVTTPMPVYLTGVLYNDLGPAALLVTGLAFALPPRRRPWGRLDLLGCAAALSLGASAKLTVAACAALLASARLTLMMLSGRRRRAREGRGVSATVAAAGFVIAGAVASLQYLRSWAVYGSPTWPFRVSVGDTVIFDGPYHEQMVMITAKGSFVERWLTSIYKLFQTTSQDANGAFGLLFAIAVVPALLWLVWRAVRRPTPMVLFFLLTIIATVAHPPASNLRYSMHLLPICYITLMCMLAPVAARRPRLSAAVIGLFVAVNSVDYARTVVGEVAEQVRGGISLLDPQRNRAWYYQFAFWPDAAHPKTHTAVHDLMRPGERLVYTTVGFPGMLYDPGYTYAVEYRAIAGEGGAPVWLASLHADDIDAVLVHAGTPEDRALAHGGSGYRLVYDQPEVELPRRARLYRRSPG